MLLRLPKRLTSDLCARERGTPKSIRHFAPFRASHFTRGPEVAAPVPRLRCPWSVPGARGADRAALALSGTDGRALPERCAPGKPRRTRRTRRFMEVRSRLRARERERKRQGEQDGGRWWPRLAGAVRPRKTTENTENTEIHGDSLPTAGSGAGRRPLVAAPCRSGAPQEDHGEHGEHGDSWGFAPDCRLGSETEAAGRGRRKPRRGGTYQPRAKPWVEAAPCARAL